MQAGMRRLTEEKMHLRRVLLTGGVPSECLLHPDLADEKAKIALDVKCFLPRPSSLERRAPLRRCAILMGAKSKAAPRPKLAAKSKATSLPIGARRPVIDLRTAFSQLVAVEEDQRGSMRYIISFCELLKISTIQDEMSLCGIVWKRMVTSCKTLH